MDALENMIETQTGGTQGKSENNTDGINSGKESGPNASGESKEKGGSGAGENKETSVSSGETHQGKNTKNGDGFSYRRLLFTTLVISGCSMVYELLISSVSTYLLGDGIEQFSITIGLYMCAMGVGSYLTRKIKNRLFNWLIAIEIAIGVIGGTCALVLFLSNIYLPSYKLVMFTEIIAIGLLAGLEIPLLLRIIEKCDSNLRLTLSSVFTFDYVGGLIGSIAFPLLLLPQIGYFATAFLAGTLNLMMALFIIVSYKKYIRWPAFCNSIAIICCALMFGGMLFSERIARQVEQGLYRDKIVHMEQSPYQKIVLTKHRYDLRMFINGNIQFSSRDEYRYHEALVHVAGAVARSHENVLILGGGDGMALREVFKYEDVKHVDMVDLDNAVVELSKTHHEIRKLNEDALSSDKLTVHNTDAFRFLEERVERFKAGDTSIRPYDMIIVDLPDPNNENLNKLYMDLFYRLCSNNLSAEGVLVLQSTSPYYAPDAFWCINKTVNAEFKYVYPFHVQVPTFGDWGFQLATREPVDIANLQLKVQGRFLTQENLAAMFKFAGDERSQHVDDLVVNSLTRPRLLEYYVKAERVWN